MRLLFLTLAAIGLVAIACAATGVVSTAAPAASAPPRTADPVAAAPAGASILVDQGGVMIPLANGGRVALRPGWATVQFSTMPPKWRSDVVVALFGADGKPATGEVRAEYESLDMDHGRMTAPSIAHEGGYRMPLEFEMKGSWRIQLHISRAGVDEKVTLVLPVAGQ